MHYPNHPDAAGRARDSILTQRFRASQECLSRPTAEGAALGTGMALSPGSDTKHREVCLPEIEPTTATPQPVSLSAQCEPERKVSNIMKINMLTSIYTNVILNFIKTFSQGILSRNQSIKIISHQLVQKHRALYRGVGPAARQASQRNRPPAINCRGASSCQALCWAWG